MNLQSIPEKVFEAAGSVVGFSGSVFIALQIRAELASTATSMSSVFILGFLMNYTFWTLYGIRFRRLAVWLVNAVAATFQATLLVIVLLKH
jgi:hypothetical protein